MSILCENISILENDEYLETVIHMDFSNGKAERFTISEDWTNIHLAESLERAAKRIREIDGVCSDGKPIPVIYDNSIKSEAKPVKWYGDKENAS